MSSRPETSHWRNLLSAFALAGLACSTTGCDKSAEVPSQTSTAAQEGADAPLSLPAYESALPEAGRGHLAASWTRERNAAPPSKWAWLSRTT